MHSSSRARSDDELDLLLVGGGLANGLIALACLARRPTLKLALIEREPRLGGNHTWCLHPNDVPAAAAALVEPLIEQRWSGYDVRFPELSRRLAGSYAAVSSSRFDAVLTQTLAASPGARAVLGAEVIEVGERQVRLSDGSTLRARRVVDARGPRTAAPGGPSGFQKFLGLELELEADPALDRPILMDACVEQLDGFRFFYVLPLAPRRILVEDTRFARDPALDVPRVRAEVLDYARRFGPVRRIVREEQGLLPMTLRAKPEPPTARPLRAGYGAGLFHPATGYSFAVALRVACAIADGLDDADPTLRLAASWRAHAQQFAYAQRLNWLLFNCFEPTEMWRVFERFYRLPEPLIHRFYALELTRSDRARIVLGAPPRGLSLRAALSNLTPSEVSP
jgi:lycopene beta-cyclase